MNSEAAATARAGAGPGKPAGNREIILRNVSKVYQAGGQEIRALENIDMVCQDGEFVCLVGPSGCGKTTLLNILAGFTAPSTGEVFVANGPVRGPGPDRGVVFQHGSLFPWATVEDNIGFGLRCHGAGRRAARQAAAAFIDLVGLKDFAKRYPYELSGGMQQRVGIARALANDPAILLMDEPFGALDAQTRELMQEELKRIWAKTGKTVFFITHSIEEALFLGTHVYVMSARPGRIRDALRVDFGTREPIHIVSSSPAFVQAKRRVHEMLRDEALKALAQQELPR